MRDWTSSFTYFHTSVRNFFDHDVIGNSNIFLPLTIQGAIIEGEEATIRSPLILHRYHAHLVYSHQIAQGVGAVTGGLTDFSPPPTAGRSISTTTSATRFRRASMEACRGAASPP